MGNQFGVTPDGFRKKTFLEILESMETMAREFFGESINLTEKSPMGMFLQVVAWEISMTWEGIENSFYNSFALSADGLALDNVVGNNGKPRFRGTYAIGQLNITGNPGTKVPKGFLVSDDYILFETVHEVILTEAGFATVVIKSLEIGTKGNVMPGTITKIVNPIAGVESIKNVEATHDGTDIESDSNFRMRYLETLREPATGDNVSQYKIWAREVEGVGNVKILPTTPSPGYTTVILADINGKPASTDLVGRVTDYIDSVRPVNAGIYVESATTKDINISMNIHLAEGYTLPKVRDEIENRIVSYFKDVSLAESYLSHAQLGRYILEVKGVIDYSDLTLNNSSSNIKLGNTEVPELKSLNMELI